MFRIIYFILYEICDTKIIYPEFNCLRLIFACPQIFMILFSSRVFAYLRGLIKIDGGFRTKCPIEKSTFLL
jgi:hypothetical protein